MKLKVNKQFLIDFEYLAEIYYWHEDGVIEEMKNWIRETPEVNMPYITNLATQWRGNVVAEENSFDRITKILKSMKCATT